MSLSYATLLALLAALAFGLPFLVTLAEHVGIPRSYGIAVTLALALVVSVYAWLRWQLRDQDQGEAPPAEPGVLPTEPYVPGFFYHQGIFRGETLLAQGQREEALQVYRAYQAILERQGEAREDVAAVIRRLEQEVEEDARASL